MESDPEYPWILNKTQAAQQVVMDLFAAYMTDPAQMPHAHSERFDGTDNVHAQNAKPEHVVADYIAGMTDRFAAKEHERLSGQAIFPA